MLPTILRGWAIACLAMAPPLIVIGFLESTKSWIDLAARAFLWPTLSLLCWAVARVMDRVEGL